MIKRRTYDKMKELLNRVKDYLGEEIPISLVSCKKDLFIMKKEEEKNFMKLPQKENYNIDFCFNEFISRIISIKENTRCHLTFF